MHLDRVGSDEAPASEIRDFSADELIRPRPAPSTTADEDDESTPPPPGREGLPKRFRMRHGRHYVDAVLGDAPLRTVREIAVSDIDPPESDTDALDLETLEQSIRRLGVIEPLVVGKRGMHYRVIAGMRRLRAARTVGLITVPCLVHDVDDQKYTDMRDAAARRLATPVAESAAMPEPAEIAAEPAAEIVSVDERLRSIVMNDLASVEAFRAKIASAADDFLARSAVSIDSAPVSTSELIADVIAAVALEARLRDVRIARVDVFGQQADYRMSIDAARCRMALTGLLQCLLSLAPGRTVLEVRSQVTTIRPALIVDCRLRADDALARFFDQNEALTRFFDQNEALTRFFDPEWNEHPCGPSGARVLAAAARAARMHHGRVQLHRTGTVTFVVPRPLSDL